MAFPTAVNAQITDSISPADHQTVAEAPAYALGAFYQAVASAAGMALQNAVTGQQQQNTLSNAAMVQGVMRLYTDHANAVAGATEGVAQAGGADILARLLTTLDASPPPGATIVADAPQTAQSGAATAQAGTEGHALIDEIRAAAAFSNGAVLDNAPAFADGLRSAADAMAHALGSLNRIGHDNRVRIVLEAALAATLAAMIREPAKAAEYETLLAAIQRMR